MNAIRVACVIVLGGSLVGCTELVLFGRTGGSSRPSGDGTVVVQPDSAGTSSASSSSTTSPTAPGTSTSSAPRTPSSTGPGTRLALGEHHTCLLEASGRVRCWGYNMQGQLGVASMRHPAEGFVEGIGDASDGPVRAIAAGGYQTCAITTAGRVWCWGQNHEGQVGSGEVTEAPVRTPTLVRGVEHVTALALGDTTSCAIVEGGAAYCWGGNSQAQVDDSGRAHLTSPTRVAGIDRVDRLAVGYHHLCALRDGRVTCRGNLARLAREIGALDEVSAISAGWEHSCALRRGVAYCWGRSYLGVLGRGRVCPVGTSSNCDADVLYPPAEVPGVMGAVSIESQDYHTCVRLESGAVTCWGNNQGHAFAEDLPAEPWQTAHPIASLTNVDELHVGGGHLCFVRGGVPRCVGNDASGAVRGLR